ncbi:MAG: hypothetical protein U1F51_08135 [Burkholderiales bacterium]
MPRLRPLHALWLPLALAAAGAATSSPAQTADKPRIAVGDQWTYRQVDKDGKEVTWGRKVLSIDGDGGFTVATAPDKTMRFDASWNFIDPRGGEFSRPAYRFPMQVGAEWSFVAKQMLQTNLVDQRNQYRIVGYEPLTVPAGTFDCFKAEGTADTTYKNSYNRRMKEAWWYCPRVNAIAKFVRDTTTTTRESGASHERVESVLVRFTPGR